MMKKKKENWKLIEERYEELKHLKENAPQGEIFIHEDFDENFQLKHQHEIMAAHWSNEMVKFSVHSSCVPERSPGRLAA